MQSSWSKVYVIFEILNCESLMCRTKNLRLIVLNQIEEFINKQRVNVKQDKTLINFAQVFLKLLRGAYVCRIHTVIRYNHYQACVNHYNLFKDIQSEKKTSHRIANIFVQKMGYKI